MVHCNDWNATKTENSVRKGIKCWYQKCVGCLIIYLYHYQDK